MSRKYIIPHMGKPPYNLNLNSIDLLKVLFMLGCRIIDFKYLTKYIIFLHIEVPINYEPNFFNNGSTREIEQYIHKLIQRKALKGYTFRIAFQENQDKEWSEESYNTMEYLYNVNDLPFELTEGELNFIEYLNKNDPYYINTRRILSHGKREQKQGRDCEGPVSDRVLYKNEGPLENNDRRRYSDSFNQYSSINEKACNHRTESNGKETVYPSSVITEGGRSS